MKSEAEEFKKHYIKFIKKLGLTKSLSEILLLKFNEYGDLRAKEEQEKMEKGWYFEKELKRGKE